MDISVVLCAYNGAASLGGALASFKQLSIPGELSWELILIDNNSTDSTREIMQELIASSARNWAPRRNICFNTTRARWANKSMS